MFETLILLANFAVTQPPPSDYRAAEGPQIPRAVPATAEPDAQLMQAMDAAIDELYSDDQANNDSAAAIARCADALWRDWGDPGVNFDYQLQVLQWMWFRLALAPKEQKAATREALRDGLLRFYYAGGYQGLESPADVSDDYHASMNMARKFFAECLVSAARDDDAEMRFVLQDVVARMKSGVTAYSPEVTASIAAAHGVSGAEFATLMASWDKRFVERFQTLMAPATPPEQLTAMVQTLTGDAGAAFEEVRLRAMDDELQRAAPWLLGGEQVSGVPPAAIPEDPCASRYRQAPAAALKNARTIGRSLRQLGRRGTRDPARVDKITKAALEGVGDDCLDQSLLATLLISYRSLLRRPGTTPPVVQALDKKLLWLARESRRLTSERHWMQWAEAVSALGGGLSRELRRYVYHDAEQTLSDPAALKAIRQTQESLRRNSSSKAGAAPASQPRDLPPTTRPSS